MKVIFLIYLSVLCVMAIVAVDNTVVRVLLACALFVFGNLAESYTRDRAELEGE